MKKVGTGLLCSMLALGSLWGASTQDALAIGAFKDGFFSRYVKKDGDANQQAFEAAASAKTGKCYICHVNMTPLGEKKLGKKVRNNYGKALSQFLEKDNFSSDRRKAEPDAVAREIQEALEKVESMKSDPDDPNSPTFLELIQSGKLPGNDTPDAEDVKKAIAARDAG